MLFYALSGRYVHEASSQLDMLMATVQKPARSLVDVMPDAPPKLTLLVDRALKYEPSARWQCAEDMARAAQEAFQELTGATIPDTQRAESGGQAGWMRAAVLPAAATPSSSGVEVVIHDASLCVSVVFEPDTLVNTQSPVGEKK
jgi:hypothetical protein